MATSTLEGLRRTVTTMDALSQDGFGEIAAIAKVALAALQLPEIQNDSDCMGYILQAIYGKAFDMNNNINATAERAGCAYTDDDMYRRRWAWSEARNTEKAAS